jgi:hypothetical protein
MTEAEIAAIAERYAPLVTRFIEAVHEDFRISVEIARTANRLMDYAAMRRERAGQG